MQYEDYYELKRRNRMTDEQLAQRLNVTVDRVKGWRDTYRLRPQLTTGGLVRHHWPEVCDFIRRCEAFRERENISLSQLEDAPLPPEQQPRQSDMLYSRHPLAILRRKLNLR